MNFRTLKQNINILIIWSMFFILNEFTRAKMSLSATKKNKHWVEYENRKAIRDVL